MRTVLLCLLVGCTYGPEPWGQTTLSVHGDMEFQGKVTQAVSNWDEALNDACGWPVFRIVPYGGNPVIQDNDWTDVAHVGVFDGDQVRIKGDLGDLTLHVTVHELGHAIGLGHVKEWWVEPDSVMVQGAAFPENVNPSPNDITRAIGVLGCQ